MNLGIKNSLFLEFKVYECMVLLAFVLGGHLANRSANPGARLPLGLRPAAGLRGRWTDRVAPGGPRPGTAPEPGNGCALAEHPVGCGSPASDASRAAPGLSPRGSARSPQKPLPLAPDPAPARIPDTPPRLSQCLPHPG